MHTKNGEEEPPRSTDLLGWQKVISEDRLKTFRLEALVGAFQDLGPQDRFLQNALARHLSDSILRLLRKKVGFNHPNGGEDIIYRVHGEIFAALMCPVTADGRNLRKAFGARVIFRMKDAIAKEYREQRTEDDILSEKHRKKDEAFAEEGGVIHDISGMSAPSKLPTGETDDVADEKTKRFDGAIDQKLSARLEELDVERILKCVPNARKRMAFRLHMDGSPFKTNSADDVSIEAALGISERTAREWVKEVRLLLAKSDEVQNLMKMKVGGKS